MAAYARSTVSSSGTYSTTYKSSRISVVSSEPDLASQLSRIFIYESSGLKDDEQKLKKIERAKRLVKEFCQFDGDTSALVERLLPAGDLDTDTADATNGVQAPLTEKLRTLLDVRDAVFNASLEIMEAQQSSGEVLSLLAAKEQRLDEAIWNMMEEVRTSILNDDDDEWAIQTRQGSPHICKVTRSLVTYIKYLWDDYSRVNPIVCTAFGFGNYVPDQLQTGCLATLTGEMVSSLEVKLGKRSESFRDHSLRFLFMINNTNFIVQQLDPFLAWRKQFLVVHSSIAFIFLTDLPTKIEEYIQKYLQVSWAPVLSCLYSHTPCWFRKNSPLPKFDLRFQKTYTAHKHWKVPDPELRTRLRNAISKKVVSGLTRYLEDNNVTNPGFTPQERKEMLLELFEG